MAPKQRDKFELLSRRSKCRVVCSLESIAVFLVLVGLTIGHAWIFVAKSDLLGTDPLVLVFLCCGSVSCLMALLFLVRIARVVCLDLKLPAGGEEKSERTCCECAKRIKRVYSSVSDVNGKYYLIKMYSSEVAETFQQCINTIQIYSCKMPLEVSMIVPTILALELTWIIRSTLTLDSIIARDRQLLMDIIIDLFCLLFPTAYVYLAFEIPLTSYELLQLTFLPTASVLLKAKDIWDDVLEVDMQRIQDVRVLQRKRSRSRESVVKGTKHVIKEQLKYFPKPMRYAFAFVNGVFLVFFVALVCFRWSTRPNEATCTKLYTKEVWYGCAMKVPFCADPFVPRCDCGVLRVMNYSQTTLPSSFGNMSSLLTLGVYRGKLESLPDALGIHQTKLRVIHVLNNQLKSLPNSVGQLENVLSLYLNGNVLVSLPESVCDLKQLRSLHVADNKLSALPKGIGKLKRLHDLIVRNNRLKALPESVCELRSLGLFTASNNNITTLPENIGNLENLHIFLAWQNNLNRLPNSVGIMKAVRHADFRYNNLTALPASLSLWSSIESFKLTGNPVCAGMSKHELPTNMQTVRESLCTKECAVNCPSFAVVDGECDDDEYIYRLTKSFDSSARPKSQAGCNTKACDDDGGDCPP